MYLRYAALSLYRFFIMKLVPEVCISFCSNFFLCLIFVALFLRSCQKLNVNICSPWRLCSSCKTEKITSMKLSQSFRNQLYNIFTGNYELDSILSAFPHPGHGSTQAADFVSPFLWKHLLADRGWDEHPLWWVPEWCWLHLLCFTRLSFCYLLYLLASSIC